MTLDAADVLQVTEIAARVAAEMSRNAWRGTGGATLPLPVLRYGTVGGAANAGAEVSVRADGDPTAVPAINATGDVLEAGDRVVVEWQSPSGVFVRSQLARAQRGNWTPVISGPSAVNTSSIAAGHYTRHGHRVTLYGQWIMGGSSALGTAAVLGGLPFPVITDGDGIPACITGYYSDVSIPRLTPAMWVINEGQSSGPIYGYNSFGGAATLLTQVSGTFPTTAASPDVIFFQGVYDTDAA